MILVDANVLIALIDERDELHDQSLRDWQKSRERSLWTTDAVLSEVCFACTGAVHLQRLVTMIEKFNLRSIEAEMLPDWLAVLGWLKRYHEHSPDWADAQLAVIASRPTVKIWTYDREFYTIWRRTDGTRIPMAVKARR